MARASGPRVGQSTALDVWLIACTVFVCMALVEFALVNLYDRQGDKKKWKMDKQTSRGGVVGRLIYWILTDGVHDGRQIAIEVNQKREHNNDDVTSSGWTSKVGAFVTSTYHKLRPQHAHRHESIVMSQQIDHVARVLYPLAFLIFNICYWVSYLG